MGEHKGIWWAAGLIVGAIALGVWLFVSTTPFILVVLVDRVGDLRKDDPVLWKGFTVGKVEKIEPLVENRIGVHIRIREDYAPRITEGSVFTLMETSLFGFAGQNGIRIETPEKAGRPFANGERVPGRNLPRTSFVEQGARWTLEQWREILNGSVAAVEEFRNSPLRQEAEATLGELKKLAEAAVKETSEGLEQFRRDHREELDNALRKLDQLREELRKQGTGPGKVKAEQ